MWRALVGFGSVQCRHRHHRREEMEGAGEAAEEAWAEGGAGEERRGSQADHGGGGLRSGRCPLL